MHISVFTQSADYAVHKVSGGTYELINDFKRSLQSRNFIRVGDEWTGPTSYARTFERARLIIGPKCIILSVCIRIVNKFNIS